MPSSRHQMLARLLEIDVSDATELPPVAGGVPAYVVDGWIYVVAVGSDAPAAVSATTGRFRLERLTSDLYPTVALYAEPPEGAEHEEAPAADPGRLDDAEKVLAHLTDHPVGTKTETIQIVRQFGGRLDPSYDEAVFPDGSSLSFGPVDGIYGATLIGYSDGKVYPLLESTVTTTPPLH